jgi:hypothetical protein
LLHEISTHAVVGSMEDKRRRKRVGSVEDNRRKRCAKRLLLWRQPWRKRRKRAGRPLL